MHPLNFDNPWIVAVDGAARRIPGWLAALVAVVVAVGCIIGGQVLAGALAAPAEGGGALARTALLYLCVFAPMLAASAALGGLVERRPRPEGWGALGGAGFGLLVGGLGFTALVAALMALGVVGLAGGAPVGAEAAAGLAASLALVALQVAGEEVLFRGWLQPVLCARWGAWVGLAAASLLFAAAHLLRTRWGPAAGVDFVLAGGVFGLLALRTGGLWAPFAAHFAWNWLELAGVGLEPNPGLGPFGAAVDLDAVGPSLLSGGADGLNGSLLCTLVLGLIAAGLALAGPRRSAVLGGS